MSSNTGTPDQRILQGDSDDILDEFEDDHFHAIVTDPPYNLSDGDGFMGREWDAKGSPKAYQEWCEQWASEALRVLKPGGHLIAFSGNRTHHRLFSAVEDAGFEIRDTLTYHYGTGFPKGSDVSKYMDKAEYRLKNDVEAFGNYLKECREEKGLSKAEIDCRLGLNTAYSWWEGRKNGIRLPDWGHYVELKDILDLDDSFDELMAKEGAERDVVEVLEDYDAATGGVYGDYEEGDYEVTAPATDPAEQWDGWRSQLKPATEFAVLARAPMSESAVYRNVLEHGCGALNIDRTRIPADTDREEYEANAERDGVKSHWDDSAADASVSAHSDGRYPANLLLDGVASRMLDEQSGECGGGSYTGANASNREATPFDPDDGWNDHSMSGTEQQAPENYGDEGGASRFFYTAKASKSERTIDGQIENDHPTVKPLSLMEWIVTLVTAPGQRVLDPFAGSGTTIMACRRLGREGIGIEMDDEHADLARKRVELAHELETERVPATEAEADEDDGPATLESFGDADDD